MLIFVLTAYFLAIYMFMKINKYPLVNKKLSLFSVLLINYMVVLAIFAVLRFYYSRLFILISFAISYLTLVVAWRNINKQDKKTYLLFNPENSARIEELKSHGIEFVFYKESNTDNYDGIVIRDFSEINSDTAQIIAKELYKGANLISFAELYASITGKIPIEYFKPELIRKNGVTITYIILKDLIERILCILLLPIILVLGLLVSVLIVIDNGFPIFFAQERVGYKEKIFKLIKFRTMRRDSELNGPAFANNNDHRITRIGKLLRKFRLDELPQIINILRGEMSLIGPRPEQVPFVENFKQLIPFYSLRHNIKPGLTGWAQIHSGYAADVEKTKEKLEYDLYYLFNQSILLDILISLKTIKILFSGYGAI